MYRLGSGERIREIDATVRRRGSNTEAHGIHDQRGTEPVLLHSYARYIIETGRMLYFMGRPSLHED